MHYLIITKENNKRELNELPMKNKLSFLLNDIGLVI